MKRHVMPDIVFGPITLPGGWVVGIPEIDLDQQTELMLIDAEISVVDFIASAQHLFERGWLGSVKWYMKYWTKKYRRRFPLLHNEDGTLEGFDAQDFLRYWVPGTRDWGTPNVEASEALDRYAANVRRTQIEERRAE